jgi:hypothetical protein
MFLQSVVTNAASDEALTAGKTLTAVSNKATETAITAKNFNPEAFKV